MWLWQFLMHSWKNVATLRMCLCYSFKSFKHFEINIFNEWLNTKLKPLQACLLSIWRYFDLKQILKCQFCAISLFCVYYFWGQKNRVSTSQWWFFYIGILSCGLYHITIFYIGILLQAPIIDNCLHTLYLYLQKLPFKK